MTDEQRSSLRILMETTLVELHDSERYLEDATQPIEPSVALGRLTRMEAISEKGVNEALHGDVKRRIERLSNALKRMDEGSYGSCLKCREDIPFGRLEAVPESLFCVPCAEKKRVR